MENYGYLEIIIGPMFSGKTTRLMETFHNYKTRNNKNCIILGHNIDNRYDKYNITSHDKKEFLECYKYNSITDFINNQQDNIVNADAILVDECQFFEDIEKVIDMVNNGKHVYLFGLDGDAEQNVFGNTFTLIPKCDKITKLNGRCFNCGIENGSIFSVCKSDFKKTDQIDVGGEDKYMALCRKCR
jgi:thymidine kinase